jgi:hypothetical protein
VKHCLHELDAEISAVKFLGVNNITCVKAKVEELGYTENLKSWPAGKRAGRHAT